MDISVTDAKGQLTDLVRRAEAGEEIVLTRHGQPVAKIAAIQPIVSPEKRQRIIDEVCTAAAKKMSKGAPAARSQDFLYGDDGMPK